MKGLVYRELYLVRKPIIITILAYFAFVAFCSLVFISTYAGNLANNGEGAQTLANFYPQAFFFAACIAMLGMAYGHNDLIEKDYKSRWQLFSYTLPMNEKKVAASKFIARGLLLVGGFLLAILGEVILSIAARKSVSLSHIGTIFLIFTFMTLSYSDIPLMLRFKRQSKVVGVCMLVGIPLGVGTVFAAGCVAGYLSSRAQELYPELEKREAMTNVTTHFFEKLQHITLIAAPFILIGLVGISYFFTVRELRRRRY